MKLELIKNENKSNIQDALNENQIKFNFFKNIIQKDLEVVLWQNKTVKIFGDFQIYADFKSELNSFDNIVSFLLGCSLDFASGSIESHISNKCSDHFLNVLITKEIDLDIKEIEMLSSKYTSYILEATTLLNDQGNGHSQKLVLDLDEKYFEGHETIQIWKYINPKFF